MSCDEGAGRWCTQPAARGARRLGAAPAPGACRERRALGRDGGTALPAFRRVCGHLQHQPTRGSQWQEAPRPVMGPGPAVQGLLQAPRVTRPLKVTYQHHLVGILHASILSRVPENFCKGPGERRAARPSVCTYKESEIGIVKKNKPPNFSFSPHVAGGLGGSTSPPSPPKGTVRGVAWGWAQGNLPAGPAATSGPRGQAARPWLKAALPHLQDPAPRCYGPLRIHKRGRLLLWHLLFQLGGSRSLLPAEEYFSYANRGKQLTGENIEHLLATAPHGGFCTKAFGVAKSIPISGVCSAATDHYAGTWRMPAMWVK